MIPVKLTAMRSGEKGFTLIEIAVAFTIFSIILAVLYSAFFLSQKAVDAVDESLIKLQECRTVLDTMKREIEAALYSKDKTYTFFRLYDKDFYGRQASQLHFTAFSRLSPGLSAISYKIDENENKLTLKKYIASAYNKIVENKKQYTDLIENMEAFTIEAKYKDKWVKTWDSDLYSDMPREIRISLKVLIKKGSGHSSNTPPELFTISDVIKTRLGKAL